MSDVLPPDHTDQTCRNSGLYEGGDGSQSLKEPLRSITCLADLPRDNKPLRRAGLFQSGSTEQGQDVLGSQGSYLGTFMQKHTHRHTHVHTHTHGMCAHTHTYTHTCSHTKKLRRQVTSDNCCCS